MRRILSLPNLASALRGEVSLDSREASVCLHDVTRYVTSVRLVTKVLYVAIKFEPSATPQVFRNPDFNGVVIGEWFGDPLLPERLRPKPFCHCLLIELIEHPRSCIKPVQRPKRWVRNLAFQKIGAVADRGDDRSGRGCRKLAKHGLWTGEVSRVNLSANSIVDVVINSLKVTIAGIQYVRCFIAEPANAFLFRAAWNMY